MGRKSQRDTKKDPAGKNSPANAQDKSSGKKPVGKPPLTLEQLATAMLSVQSAVETLVSESKKRKRREGDTFDSESESSSSTEESEVHTHGQRRKHRAEEVYTAPDLVDKIASAHLMSANPSAGYAEIKELLKPSCALTPHSERALAQGARRSFVNSIVLAIKTTPESDLVSKLLLQSGIEAECLALVDLPNGYVGESAFKRAYHDFLSMKSMKGKELNEATHGKALITARAAATKAMAAYDNTFRKSFRNNSSFHRQPFRGKKKE